MYCGFKLTRPLTFHLSRFTYLIILALFEEKVGIIYYCPSVRLSCSVTPPRVLELGPSNFWYMYWSVYWDVQEGL